MESQNTDLFVKLRQFYTTEQVSDDLLNIFIEEYENEEEIEKYLIEMLSSDTQPSSNHEYADDFVDFLSQAYPNYEKDDILALLQSHGKDYEAIIDIIAEINDGEVNVSSSGEDCICSQSENDSMNELMILKNMFSHIDDSVIQDILMNYSLDDAIEYLLNYEEIKRIIETSQQNKSKGKHKNIILSTGQQINNFKFKPYQNGPSSISKSIKRRLLLEKYPTLSPEIIDNALSDPAATIEDIMKWADDMLGNVKTVYNEHKRKPVKSDQVKKPLQKEKYSFYELKDLAVDYFNQSRMSYREAGKIYRTNHGQAINCTMKGKQYQIKSREYSELAAKAFIDSNLDRIDLHSLSLDIAMHIMECIIRYSKQRQYNQERAISVITGRGLHSVGGVAVIKPKIIKLFEKENCRYKKHAYNPGELILYL